MRIREPRARWTWFLWLWAAIFGGVPLFMLGAGEAVGGAPTLFLLLFPAVAVGVLVPMVRRSMRAGFTLAEDGIHGAHDAEERVLPWQEVQGIVWRWAEETSGVEVNGRPLPDGYALHALLRDGRHVRLMQRVAARYGQQQDLNEQLAAARAAGVLPVDFDATIPTHDGAWSGTPPARNHTEWDGEDLPPATSPLVFSSRDTTPGSADAAGDAPRWPTD